MARKCKKCGHKLALGNARHADLEFQFDQEPYESGEIEPVYIGGQASDSIDSECSIVVNICPACATIGDIWIEDE